MPLLANVNAVIAETFERTHRFHLLRLGVLPLEFVGGATRQSPGLTGFETFTIDGLDDPLSPRATLTGGALPHRHAGRAQLLQARWHSPLRAAAVGGEGVSVA